MVNKTVLEKLESKIILMLEKYDMLQEENRVLKESISSSHKTEASLRQEILNLKEEEELKDLELEEMALRISKSMELSA